MPDLVSAEAIEQRIFLIRGHKVMIDRDLAELYQVPTKSLNQSVKRNAERFPDSFMFRLTRQEARELVTDCDRFASLKHASGTPFAFTEYGVLGRKIAELQRKVKNHDHKIDAVFEAIRELMQPPVKRRPKIGFHPRA